MRPKGFASRYQLAGLYFLTDNFLAKGMDAVDDSGSSSNNDSTVLLTFQTKMSLIIRSLQIVHPWTIKNPEEK